MTPIRILVATLGLAATAALAQPPAGSGRPGPGPVFGGPPGQNIERLAVLLDLDAYQKQEVERVFKEQRDAMQAQRKAHESSGERPSFEDLQTQREQVREDTIAKLQNVLSELQMTKLKLLMEPPPPARGFGGHRGPPRAGDTPAGDGN